MSSLHHVHSIPLTSYIYYLFKLLYVIVNKQTHVIKYIYNSPNNSHYGTSILYTIYIATKNVKVIYFYTLKVYAF